MNTEHNHDLSNTDHYLTEFLCSHCGYRWDDDVRTAQRCPECKAPLVPAANLDYEYRTVCCQDQLDNELYWAGYSDGLKLGVVATAVVIVLGATIFSFLL